MTRKRVKRAPRRQQVYDYIMWFWKNTHTSPTNRQIAEKFQTSTSVIDYYLKGFEKEGLIEKRPQGAARSIVPFEIAKILDEGLKDYN